MGIDTVTTLAAPTLKLQLENGGSHTDATTRYYRACWVDNSTQTTNMEVQSPWSDEVSVTFSSPNLSTFIGFSTAPSGAAGLCLYRTDTSGDYFGSDGKTRIPSASATLFFVTHSELQETTVDQDSSSGTNVLYVADTTGFVANEYICIDFENAGGGTEYAMISSVTAGVSLTLDRNLTNTHTAAQADTVKEAELDDNAA